MGTKVGGEKLKIKYSGNGNPFWGKKHSEETKRKIAESTRIAKEGKKRPEFSNEWRNNIGKSQKGRKHSKESIEKRIATYRLNHPIEDTKIYKQKSYYKYKNYKCKLEWKCCELCKSYFTGKYPKIKNRRFCSQNCSAKFCTVLDKNPNWKGGISFEEYPRKFNDKLKDEIRTRDNNTCKICGLEWDGIGYKYSVHHIDYNKHNLSSNNLITLCHICHIKTNYNRDTWMNRLQIKMKEVLELYS